MSNDGWAGGSRTAVSACRLTVFRRTVGFEMST